jgi:hypothetical protein
VAQQIMEKLWYNLRFGSNSFVQNQFVWWEFSSLIYTHSDHIAIDMTLLNTSQPLFLDCKICRIISCLMQNFIVDFVVELWCGMRAGLISFGWDVHLFEKHNQNLIILLIFWSIISNYYLDGALNENSIMN